MRQEIFCYTDNQEQMHFIGIDGSLEAHDILAGLIVEVAKLSERTPRDILHKVAGKLQNMHNKEALV